MADSQQKQISKGMATGSAGTITSRISGLARDMILSRCFGTNASISAFFFVFAIPNTFRRLFGEGALSEAFIPVFNEKLHKDGRSGAYIFLSQVLSILGMALVSLCGIAIGLSFLIARLFPNALTPLEARLLPILLPYMIFICLAGFLAGVLNTFRHFSVPAFAPVLLNLCLIAAALSGRYVISDDSFDPGVALAIGVLVAGVLQLLAVLPVLRHHGVKIQFMPNFRSPGVRELGTLIIPGMIAAGAYQINVLCDKFLANWLDKQYDCKAIASLYYAERLVYLPVGVFAVALTAACLPIMSRAFAKGEHDSMEDALFYSIRHILFLSLPCVAGLMILGKEAIQLFYGGGEFGAESLSVTLSVVMFYAPGIPAFAAIKIIRSAFYCRKNTKTPMRIGILCIVINVILNVCLMIPLRQRGLALATCISSFLNITILSILLYREIRPKSAKIRSFLLAVTKQLVVLSWAACAMYFCRFEVETGSRIVDTLLRLGIPTIAGVGVYLIGAALLKCAELRELLGIFRRK
ncbi:murein biosynthesis integral membrane protein MurJ [bacterium M21]|nr:murein biosynthesis integral membrane protein MurJ [bacterium M21]